MNSFRSSHSGFTVTELLVAVALLAIVAALLLAATSHVVESSRRTGGLSDLRQIGIAIHLYAQDHRGEIPPFNNNPVDFKAGKESRSNSAGNQSTFADLLIPQYLPSRDVFFAPMDRQRRGNREQADGWARDPGSSRFDRHSYYYVYMNPSPGVINASRAALKGDGGLGYGEIWNVRTNALNKVVAFSAYYDHLWPVYHDGTMILRLSGSVEWYANGTFRRDRSSIGQFGVPVE